MPLTTGQIIKYLEQAEQGIYRHTGNWRTNYIEAVMEEARFIDREDQETGGFSSTEVATRRFTEWINVQLAERKHYQRGEHWTLSPGEVFVHRHSHVQAWALAYVIWCVMDMPEIKNL